MLNLLSNSSKFTKNGTITVEVKESDIQDKALDFVISDTGIGMTPDQVDKVFKPFTQADEKTTRKFGGTGLGLTITKMFAEMMGGDISLTSEEDKGTIFTVTIPLAVVDKKKQNETELITRTSGQDSDYKVLVIDDDDNAQDMMRKFLEKQNVSILQAKTGEDGLKLAAEHLPDVITLDVMMPEMDGIEACEKIREVPELSETVITFLTARGEDYSQVAGFDAGADDYITKPIKPKVLVSKVKALLRRFKESDAQESKIKLGNLTINREEYKIVVGKDEMVLPRKEFELLSLLASKPGKVFKREDILDRVWGNEVVVGGRTIDVHIRKLREKLGDDRFKTVKGVGYKFVV